MKAATWLDLRPAPSRHPVDAAGDSPERLLGFVLTAAVVGALTGVAASTFRLLLDHGADVRHRFAGWVGGHWWGVFPAVGVCAAAAAFAAMLVARIEPHAEGSGIPRVEAEVEGRTEPGRSRIFPVKYVGGLIAISSGLALGREGPSVQMGGTLAVIVGRATHRRPAELRILIAAGAAAGLGTAFNAPIAGGVFVLEELLKRFDPKTTIATLVSSAAGFATAHLIISGPDSDFRMPTLAPPHLADAPWVLLVGVLCGALGVLYNRAVMLGLRAADSSRMPPELRAGLIGVAVGVVVWCAPNLVGSGDDLTQKALLGQGAWAAVLGILAARIALGVVSYSAGTPGGLFAPMLVLGSHAGLLVGLLAAHVDPHSAPPAAFALIGMAAFFTATVHAPVTGLILATELTDSTSQLAPMLGACAVAMLTAVALRSRPIYDLLTDRAARRTAVDATVRTDERQPILDMPAIPETYSR